MAERKAEIHADIEVMWIKGHQDKDKCRNNVPFTIPVDLNIEMNSVAQEFRNDQQVIPPKR